MRKSEKTITVDNSSLSIQIPIFFFPKKQTLTQILTKNMLSSGPPFPSGFIM